MEIVLGKAHTSEAHTLILYSLRSTRLSSCSTPLCITAASQCARRRWTIREISIDKKITASSPLLLTPLGVRTYVASRIESEWVVNCFYLDWNQGTAEQQRSNVTSAPLYDVV